METKLTNEKADLNTSLDEAGEQVKGLQEEVKTLTESNEDLEKKLDDAKDDSARYQHAEEVTKKSLDSLTIKHTTLEKEHKTL